ncbi:MAG: hypothetical protein BWK76_09160 [Desulfobulbaceae bacterium A2]|nr:MAG: hypothetical protein BWK76_09160 [Desulfobulbaceae bacterium A2]
MLPWYRLLLAGLVLLALTHSPVLAAGPMIEEIGFNAISAQEENISFKLNGPHLPKIFSIKNGQPRVVFDFPGVGYPGTRPRSIATKGNLVQLIRVGVHQEPAAKTRVVFDLVTTSSLDVKHQFDEATNTLTITIFQVGPGEAKSPPKVAAKKEGKKTASEPPLAQTPVPAAVVVDELPAGDQAPGAVQKQGSTTETPSSADVTQPAPLGLEPVPPTPAAAVPAKKAAKDKSPEITQAQDAKSSPPPAATGAKTSARPVPPTLTDQPSAPTATGGGAPPLLKNISFDANSSRGEMILFYLNEFYPPIVFGVEQGLPKVICDFMNTKSAPEVGSQIEAKGKHVEHIRVAQHQNPDKLRVVIDLAPGSNYDLQQVFFKEDNIFVIIVNQLGDNKGKTGAEATPSGSKDKK